MDSRGYGLGLSGWSGLHASEIRGEEPEREDIGLIDASVVAIAERLRVTTIASTDRRHFATIRPRHIDTFELIP